MTIFVDTSAFYAVLDGEDEFHEAARTLWVKVLSEGIPLTSSNYVVVESFALIQRRLGMEALQAFNDEVLPVIQIQWVDADDHQSAAQAVLAADRRRLSLVDCTSFQLMHDLGLRSAFAFDKHFQEQGFQVVPEVASGAGSG